MAWREDSEDIVVAEVFSDSSSEATNTSLEVPDVSEDTEREYLEVTERSSEVIDVMVRDLGE